MRLFYTWPAFTKNESRRFQKWSLYSVENFKDTLALIWQVRGLITAWCPANWASFCDLKVIGCMPGSSWSNETSFHWRQNPWCACTLLSAWTELAQSSHRQGCWTAWIQSQCEWFAPAYVGNSDVVSSRSSCCLKCPWKQAGSSPVTLQNRPAAYASSTVPVVVTLKAPLLLDTFMDKRCRHKQSCAQVHVQASDFCCGNTFMVEIKFFWDKSLGRPSKKNIPECQCANVHKQLDHQVRGFI